MRLDVALAAAGGIAIVLAAGDPAAAEQRGYLMPIVGRVIAVNRAAGTIVIHHGMLETMNAGDETCVVPRARLRYIGRGMELSAVADTRHRPWRLNALHRLGKVPHRPARGTPYGLAAGSLRARRSVAG